MKKYSLVIGLFTLITACNNGSDETETTTGNLMEMEPSQQELDELALVDQPQVIQDFFGLEETTIGDKFCYDYTGLSQLVLYGNDTDESWSKFEVSDNYLTAYHAECDVLLEFMTFDMGGEKMAFLSQMNKGSQQFNCLQWNTSKNAWVASAKFPRPNLVEYFADLSPENAKLVREYGADFIYINPEEENATFLFSEWSMGMNLGEKEMLEFKQDVDYEFELNTSGGKFQLNRSSLTEDVELAEIN